MSLFDKTILENASFFAVDMQSPGDYTIICILIN